MKSIIIAGVMIAVSFTAVADIKKIDLNAVSSKLISKAATLKSAGKLSEAQFSLEKALVANPKNAKILVALGEIHEAQGKVGKGLKYYRNALIVDPTSRHALKNQAFAFLKKKLPLKAEISMSKLSAICADACDELTKVTAAIKTYKDQKASELMAGMKKEEPKKKAQ